MKNIADAPLYIMNDADTIAGCRYASALRAICYAPLFLMLPLPLPPIARLRYAVTRCCHFGMMPRCCCTVAYMALTPLARCVYAAADSFRCADANITLPALSAPAYAAADIVATMIAASALRQRAILRYAAADVDCCQHNAAASCCLLMLMDRENRHHMPATFAATRVADAGHYAMMPRRHCHHATPPPRPDIVCLSLPPRYATMLHTLSGFSLTRCVADDFFATMLHATTLFLRR